MGRSGTSLTTRILNLLGVDLGPPDDFIPARDLNPTGFWERRRFDDLNRRLLHSQHGGVSNPPRFDRDWTPPADLATEARALVGDVFSDSALWGWKDPKNCLTLPFWQAVLPPMRYVICIRDPGDFAASVQSRSTPHGATALDIWLACMSRALTYTAGEPRIVVSFESYFEDPAKPAAALARFIGRRPAAPEVDREIHELVDRSLWRSRTAGATAAADDGTAEEVSRLYALLRAVCDEEAISDGSPAATELHAAADRYAQRLIEAGR